MGHDLLGAKTSLNIGDGGLVMDLSRYIGDRIVRAMPVFGNVRRVEPLDESQSPRGNFIMGNVVRD